MIPYLTINRINRLYGITRRDLRRLARAQLLTPTGHVLENNIQLYAVSDVQDFIEQYRVKDPRNGASYVIVNDEIIGRF